MTEQRIAQIVLMKQHDHPDLRWGNITSEQLMIAMDSKFWDYEHKDLMTIALGKTSEPSPEPEPIAEKPTRQPKPERKKLEIETITAYELANMDIPDVKWFVPDLIPEGLTLLAGAPKIGKSFFAWNIALAVAEGGIALSEIDIDTPRNVTYMAMEDPLPLLAERLHLMCPEGVPNNVHIANDFFGLKFDDNGLELIPDLLDKTESELLIVDTWGHVKPNPQSKGGTSYDNDYAAMIPVQRFAHERNIAVVLVTHTTKGRDPENPYNDIQGSAGMQAGCDSMLMIAREEGMPILRAMGRRIIETEYAMTLDEGIWKLAGDADEAKLSPARRELLDLLRESYGKGMTVKALSEIVGKAPATISKMLTAMKRSGLIEQPEKSGKYYAP